MTLWETLGVEKGVTAILGSGGKTTMLYTLAEELCALGRVICTTTTHIAPPDHISVFLQAEEIRNTAENCFCAGAMTAEGKLGPPALPIEELAQLCDYLLVEADGSRRLPLKAHAPHEPVIPSQAGRRIVVVGASGLGQPIEQVVHRPEIFCRLTGARSGDSAAPALVAKALTAEGLGNCYFINQWDACPPLAETLASLLPPPVCLGALQKGVWHRADGDSRGR